MNYHYRFFWLIFLFSCSVASSAQTVYITLLGTGNPQPTIERFGPSTLIEVEGQYFLFDCGRGVSQRLWQKNLMTFRLDAAYLFSLMTCLFNFSYRS